MEKICYIMAAGESYADAIHKKTGDMIIAADAGFEALKNMGITPDIAVGDFDSLNYIPEGCEVVKLNPIKDDTDTMMCVKLGIEKGYKSFIIMGAMGGRIDHALGNLQILAYLAKQGRSGFIIAENELITAIYNATAVFDKACNGYISLIAMDERIIATEKGLKYTLDEQEVCNFTTLGISNEFIGEQASVSVKGLALLIFGKENGISAVKLLEDAQ